MASTEIQILYHDDNILVINKPTAVSVTADRTGQAELTDILSEQLGAQLCSRLRLVHRLDKHTSGVMILAKNAPSQSILSSHFENRLVEKTYLALVTGIVCGRRGMVDVPLAHSRKKPQLMCIDRKKGKEALTEWKLVADFGTIAMLAVRPLTGRTHQIRVHLPSIGLPLAIDPLYGNSKPLFLSDFKPDYQLGKDRTEKPLMTRLTLHAYQIEFPKPLGNVPQYFVAALDKKFAATVKLLAKHNPKGPNAFANPDDFGNIINTQRLACFLRRQDGGDQTNANRS
jgi:RluA family pseudouridine synthase